VFVGGVRNYIPRGNTLRGGGLHNFSWGEGKERTSARENIPHPLPVWNPKTKKTTGAP